MFNHQKNAINKEKKKRVFDILDSTEIPELALQLTSVWLRQRMSVLQYKGADRMLVVWCRLCKALVST